MGGPDEAGDNGSVTQSLVLLFSAHLFVSKMSFLPMRSCSHKLSNCVSERRCRIYMENRERVFAFNQSASRKNHRNEVRAGVLEKR